MSVGNNSSLITALLAFALAQSLKIVSHRCGMLPVLRGSAARLARRAVRAAGSQCERREVGCAAGGHVGRHAVVALSAGALAFNLAAMAPCRADCRTVRLSCGAADGSADHGSRVGRRLWRAFVRRLLCVCRHCAPAALRCRHSSQAQPLTRSTCVLRCRSCMMRRACGCTLAAKRRCVREAPAHHATCTF